MEQKRNRTGWLLAAVMIIVAGTALVVTTLASPQPESSQNPITSALEKAPDATADPEIPAPNEKRTVNASAIGYGGPVLVRLTLDGENRIQALDIGGARFQETEGVGSKVKDESFSQSFIRKIPPLELNRDVDAVAGASVSSKAVVDAVNDAAAFLNESDTN